MRFCPDCGKKLPKLMPKHCPECGTALVAQMEPQAEKSASEKSGPGIFTSFFAGLGLSNFDIRRALFIVSLAALVIGAIFANLVASTIAQYIVNGKPELVQAQMQESVRMYSEELQRRQIALDTVKKTELEGEIKQFMTVMQYDAQQMKASVMDYNISENVSDKNLARKAAAAQKFALQVNEFYSHIDGMLDIYHDNVAFIKRFATDQNSTNETAIAASMNEGKAAFRKIESQMQLELESFAAANPSRMLLAADAIRALKESEALP